MNGKGIVLEVKGSKLIVLTPDGRFRKIRSNGGELMGQEVWLAPEGRFRPVKMSWWLPAAAAALALLIAIPAMLAVRVEARPVVAYLSMDINPSFELGVDEKLKVRSLRAVNKDAAPFVEALEYEGRPVSEVMDRLASELADTSYLQGEQANIVFAGVRLDGAEKELLSDLNLQAKAAFQKAAAQSGDANVKITQIESTPGVMDEAAYLGLSTGQMTVYLLAKDKGYSVSLDQFRTKPLHAAATWKGGIGALVGDAEELNQDKLNRLLEEEKQERASEASGASSAPSPTPKPKTSSLGAGGAGSASFKPSAAVETKPAVAQPSAPSTKTPPPSQKHLPKPKVSAVESHLTPLPDLERGQSREELSEREEELADQAGVLSEEWKKYSKQQKENWLKEKKAAIEKLREEAEKARKELERRAREAEERLKQTEEKWKKDAKKQAEERLKEHETQLKHEQGKEEKQKEQEEKRLEEAEEEWEEAEEEWEEAEDEWEEAQEEWDNIEEEWEEKLEQHFGH
ncbi:anti-sigma factor domain-containing protein [Paenibacillus herberti]|uniref:RsgI N-terminal anti-sigma domain-containing protein n=1 Tax=Paenibacillus herberti TaxID=1619309 RepID=A0A229P5U6_9BACL|nr:anti-sigma factor domain-containing protein [Paenibacillus herberti]OXM17229.1 hypothetical protein CGZ75_11650 [Paenibacillus herberti]